MTSTGKNTIDNAVTTAKTYTIDNLNQNYNSILTDWDKTKAILDIEIQSSIMCIQNTLDKSSQVTNNVSQISKDLEETKHNLELLDKSIDNVVVWIKNAVE